MCSLALGMLEVYKITRLNLVFSIVNDRKNALRKITSPLYGEGEMHA